MGPIIYPTVAQCRTPGCHNPGGHGLWAWSDFCEPCAAILASIREECQAEASAAHPGTRTGRKPECTTPGCHEPRRAGETVCLVCESMDLAVAA